VHHTLDEMKDSLSFINSKLGASKTSNNLTNNEISQLQNRLASTEAQMYKILNALDAASNKVNELTKNTRESLEQPQQVNLKN
jgi:phage-related tail protein